jgi:dihydrolipoamide dehydrogenase
MRRAADGLNYVEDSLPYGLGVNVASFDLGILRERQRKIVDSQVQGLTAHFKALGVKLVIGRAAVEKPGTVRVAKRDGTSEECPYDRLLLATGSEPVSLPGLPIDGKKIVTSDQALWLTTTPKRLLVVGGGVIGCELAQIFGAFGSDTTIVEALDRPLPLPSVDAEISKVYARSLKKIKLAFLASQTVFAVEENPDGSLKVRFAPFSGPDAPGEIKDLTFDTILVSVGRRPALGGLDLKALGVTQDSKGWLKVNDDYQTQAPNVWAVGDCLGPAKIMLAHVATAEALVAAESMVLGQSQRKVNYAAIPSAIFTAPEIGCVGLSLAQASQDFPGAKAQDFLFRQLGKAQAMGETDGLFRLVLAPDNRILGAHIIGAQASSLLGEATLAVAKGLTADDLAQTIHAHPTLPEGFWECAMAATGQPLHG